MKKQKILIDEEEKDITDKAIILGDIIVDSRQTDAAWKATVIEKLDAILKAVQK